MGLFGNKNKENKESNSTPPVPNAAPPMPPGPNSNMAPPMPGAMAPPGAPTEDMKVIENATMPAPPIAGNLDDIKQQVSGNEQENMPQNNNEQTSMVPAQEIQSEPQNDLENLFDLEEFDMDNLNSQNQIETQREENVESSKNTHQSSHELKFLNQEKGQVDESKPIFVTTGQFKAMLELVDEVKLKVKDSSERYLRLLDIKSEENVEYENLKKDFTSIEDKLYEIDSIIFE